MKEGWVLIFSAIEEYQARIADEVLKQNGIESLVVRKQDSMFPSIGEAELYTPEENVEQAKEILRANDLLE
ncbi:MAG TPA: DUF2007 domain-containing protein [Saprospiraceae bacterium]|nr:DUF2007 domain-containing protein [Saprospiraceae bacterium]HMP22501.1 DUF2007 domain-containing protein [Saprospiraceae bacterium]